MRIDKTAYEFSHGRKPRGYGLWCFELGRGHVRFEWTGCYADAERQALKAARENNHALVIKVLP